VLLLFLLKGVIKWTINKLQYNHTGSVYMLLRRKPIRRQLKLTRWIRKLEQEKTKNMKYTAANLLFSKQTI